MLQNGTIHAANSLQQLYTLSDITNTPDLLRAQTVRRSSRVLTLPHACTTTVSDNKHAKNRYEVFSSDEPPDVLLLWTVPPTVRHWRFHDR